MENEKQTAGKIVRVLKSGTAAGILAALAVLAVFILAATYLRSLFFGIILAIFLLPLEKFFECHVFQWRWMQTLCAVLGWPWLQVSKLIDRVAGKVPTPAEIAERRRKRLILSSSVCAFAVFLIALTAVSCLVFAGGKFAASNMKEKMTDFGKDNPRIQKIVEQGSRILVQILPDVPKSDSGGETPEITLQSLWKTALDYVRSHIRELAKPILSKGVSILSAAAAVVAFLGSFALNLLLGIFFFFFFLQHMALFRTGDSGGESIGHWCVRGVFGSRWMPAVSSTAKTEAVEIIDRIVLMLNKWILGYLWIIIIETILYTGLFYLFSVPYAPLLALLAGLTILLPFLGPIGSFLLTVTVCLQFCAPGERAGTLIGAAFSYCLINGLLEQFFLYPKLIGNAIGLTTLETIIVVLLGGLAAGIPGMIFAIPAAGCLKYLIPKIYHAVHVTVNQDLPKGDVP